MAEELQREYVDAYESWQKQLLSLHKVLLAGQKLDPPRMKGLLNREARAKDRYDRARRRMLGLSGED